VGEGALRMRAVHRWVSRTKTRQVPDLRLAGLSTTRERANGMRSATQLPVAFGRNGGVE